MYKKETSEIVLGKKAGHKKEWISVDTLILMNQRKPFKTAINNSKTRTV